MNPYLVIICESLFPNTCEYRLIYHSQFPAAYPQQENVYCESLPTHHQTPFYLSPFLSLFTYNIITIYPSHVNVYLSLHVNHTFESLPILHM